MEDQSTTIGGRDSFLKRPYSLSTFFAAGILLFLLPFVQVKCSSTTLAENTGLGIALGKQWKISTSWGNNDLSQKLKETVKTDKGKLSDRPNIFAIVALTAGLAGLVFSLAKGPIRPLVSMCAGILGTIMLIALMIQFKILMRSAGSGSKNAELEAGISTLIKVHFTIWYFLSLFCFASAGYVGFRHHKDELEERLKTAHDFEFEKRGEVNGE